MALGGAKCHKGANYTCNFSRRDRNQPGRRTVSPTPPETLWGAQQLSTSGGKSKSKMIISEVWTVFYPVFLSVWVEGTLPATVPALHHGYSCVSCGKGFKTNLWQLGIKQIRLPVTLQSSHVKKKNPGLPRDTLFPKSDSSPSSASTAFNLNLTHLPKIRSKWDLTAPFDLSFLEEDSPHWTGDTMRKYCETIAAIYERSVPAARGIAKLVWRREREQDNKREKKKSGVSPARGAVYAVS